MKLIPNILLTLMLPRDIGCQTSWYRQECPDFDIRAPRTTILLTFFKSLLKYNFELSNLEWNWRLIYRDVSLLMLCILVRQFISLRYNEYLIYSKQCNVCFWNQSLWMKQVYGMLNTVISSCLCSSNQLIWKCIPGQNTT